MELEIRRDARGGHVAIDPIPPAQGPGSQGGMLEPVSQRCHGLGRRLCECGGKAEDQSQRGNWFGGPESGSVHSAGRVWPTADVMPWRAALRPVSGQARVGEQSGCA